MRTVVLPIESSRASGRNLLCGIAKYSRLHGPWTFYWEPGGLEEIFPRLRKLNADGIIMRDSERLEEVLDIGIPVIIVGHYREKIPESVNIITDSKRIGRMAAEHLLDCGFRNFAFCGNEDKPWSVERCASFSERIAAESWETFVYRQPFFPRKITWEKEQKYLVEWLLHLPKPVGLMTCNDDRSQQVLQACKMAALKVPEEVAILGVDNDELICNLSDPPLSSVSINFERAGYEGAAVLDRLMNGKTVGEKEILVHASHIVARQSTDITAINNADVANAVSFIRKNAKQCLRVSHVVQSTALSRRVLEKRFRDCLGRTILEEIRRVRANQIAQMLVETNMSILDIALSFGFLGTEHIARYFQREKGMSLIEYREKYRQR